MNITITVALITSLSTLAGGLIASLIGLRVQNRQIVAAASLAAAERNERRLQRRIESRKQAYIQFLDEISSLEEMLHKCWWEETVDGDEHSEFSETYKRLTQAAVNLDHSISIVTVEGPAEVSTEARELWRVIFEEIQLTMRISYQSTNIGKALVTASNDKYGQALKARGEAKKQFIQSIEKGMLQFPMQQSTGMRSEDRATHGPDAAMISGH